MERVSGELSLFIALGETEATQPSASPAEAESQKAFVTTKAPKGDRKSKVEAKPIESAVVEEPRALEPGTEINEDSDLPSDETPGERGVPTTGNQKSDYLEVKIIAGRDLASKDRNGS